jgi:hypothetical protein
VGPGPNRPHRHRQGHGRITARAIQILPAPDDLPFPHVRQVLLIERHVTGLKGEPVSSVAALGVASPEPEQAGPADLAGYVREHWSIESLHWIRSLGVLSLLYDVALKRFTGSFCNTLVMCSARYRRCSEPCPLPTCNVCNTVNRRRR